MFKTVLAAVMAVTVTISLAGQAPAPRLKVYCFTAPNPSGFVDQASKEREDSLKDLREAVVKKKDWLELVDSSAGADMTVEVMERRIVSAGQKAGTTSTYVDKNGKSTTTTLPPTSLSNYILRATMRVGSYQNDMAGQVSSEFIGGQWRAAAGQIAGEIERWAKANLSKLRTSRQAPQPAAAAERATAAAPRGTVGPRQTIIDWYLAPTVQASEAYLLKTTVSQVQAFRASATPDQAMIVTLVDLAIAPGPTYAKIGQPVSAQGQPAWTVVLKGPSDTEIGFQPEAVAGDRAFVPVSIKEGDNPARTGTFELIRENGAWRIAAVDLGQELRLPRLDSPKFIGEFAAVVVKSLEEERARLREASVKARLRTLASAQFTFSAIHGGVYAPLECLEKPRLCAPADPPEELLMSGMDVPGYTGTFQPGPPATAADLRLSKGARRGLKSWAYVFAPAAAGTDVRGYCTDSTARLCTMPAGAPAKLAGPVCPATCVDVK